MCAGRIIADSDDEDDISPVPSPVRTGASSLGGGNFPVSSDPGFFRSEFLAQQEAAIYDPGSTEDTSSGRLPNDEGSAARGGDEPGAYDPWAIMSSPDSLRYTPKSKAAARSKVSKTYSRKELLSSNAASPNGAASMIMPEAKHATPSKVSKTYSKKNPGVNDSASSRYEAIDLVSPDHLSTARPSSKRAKSHVDEDGGEAREGPPRPARPAKKKRISDLRLMDAGNLEDGGVDIPSSLDAPDTTSMPPPTRRNGRDGTNGNSGHVYVEASRMTSSQKGQYEEVNFPSLSSFDEPLDLNMNTHLARSSGSATVAYHTPTQYRHPDPPSMPPLPQDLSPVESRRGSKKRRLNSPPPTAENPRSSPDVISGAPGRDEIQPFMAMEPPIVEQDNSCDEDWNETDHGFPRPQERQPSRTQKRQRTTMQESTEIRDDIMATAGYIDDAGAQAEADHPPALKKRGRKKKEKIPEPEPVAPAAEDAQPTEDAALQKRKRGRPRRSDKVGAASNVLAKGLEPSKADRGSETSHNVGDGSEEASCRDTDAKERDEHDNKEDAEMDAKKEDDRDADVRPKPSLPTDTEGGVVETSNAGATTTGEDGTSGEKREPATKAQTDTRGKTEGLLRPGAKPVYRVGLSKRTRITPLLKCIRKT